MRLNFPPGKIDMQTSELARRYARALLAILDTDEAAAAALEDLRFAAKVFARAPEWLAILSNSMHPATERSEQLGKVLAPHVGPAVLRLLTAAIHKRRLALLSEIAQSMESMLDKRLGILRARMISARPMTEDRRHQLERRLAERTGINKVCLEVDVDPDLLGGCVMHIGSRRIDASCRGRIEALRERITQE